MTETPTQPDKKHEVPLVKMLLALNERQDRGALAALRTGLGKPPGTAARMFPIVAPFLHSNDGPSTQAAFLTAALFASHPEHAEIGNLGASLWRATKREANPNGKHGEAGVEARFAAALDADPEDLPRHLAGLVSLCKSASAPIDWHQFHGDVARLLSDWTRNKDANKLVRDEVKRDWAIAYWRGFKRDNTSHNGEEDTQP